MCWVLVYGWLRVKLRLRVPVLVVFCRRAWITERGNFFLANQKNLYKPRVRTNTGKQMISVKAIDLWKSVPQNLKVHFF